MSEKMVLTILCDHANRGHNWTAWPTLATIRRLAGTSERTVRRAILALEGKGLIRVTRTKAISTLSHEPRTVNHYRLDLDTMSSETLLYQVTGQGGQMPSGQGGQMPSGQGGRQIRVSPDPGILDPGMEKEREVCESKHSHVVRFVDLLNMGFSEAEQIMNAISSPVVELYLELETKTEASKEKVFRDWLKRLIAEYSRPNLRHEMPEYYQADDWVVWQDLLFDVCRRKLEGLRGNADSIEEMRAWMRTSCRDGWIGAEVRCTQESFDEVRREWAKLKQQEAAG